MLPSSAYYFIPAQKKRPMGQTRDSSGTSLPLMVGIGIAGVRYLEGNLPEGVEVHIKWNFLNL